MQSRRPGKPEVYSLEYIEDFFGPSTAQIVEDRSPQYNGHCRAGSQAKGGADVPRSASTKASL